MENKRDGAKNLSLSLSPLSPPPTPSFFHLFIF